MHATNAANFPGHGNGQGVTAGFKADLIYDLLTGQPVDQKLGGGTEQDKSMGVRILNIVSKNDLVLRDMGYFSLDVFESIESKGAFWLSRLPLNVSVKTLDGISLEKILWDKRNNRLDLIVKVGAKGLKCRLVAVRADLALAAKRRRDRKKNSKSKPSRQSVVRDGWHILLTNLDDTHQSDELFEIYKLRWNIEVRFKAWKQAINMQSLFCRYSNYNHQQALIYAALIFQLVTLKVAAQLDLRGRALSLENFSKEIAKSISLVTYEVPLTFIFDARHVLMERRKRKSLMNKIVTT